MKFINIINNARRTRRGAVALEALLSIIILLLMTSVTWGICILIFNFSIISTSTQLASQAALLTYDRATYRGEDNLSAIQEAERVSFQVFRENSCGTVRGQFTADGRPNSGCRDIGNINSDSRFRIEFQCRNSGDSDSLTNWGDCRGSVINNPCRATMLRVTGQSNVAIPFSYLINTGRETGVRNARITSRAFSFINISQFTGVTC